MVFFYLFIAALIVGSFVSFITYRLGTGQNMLFSYSKCTNCNYRLKFYNLVPLFSWFLQRGRCSTCKTEISMRYPVIELFFVILFNLIFLVNDSKIDYNLLFLLIIATIMVIISIVDIEYYFAPLSMQILLLISVVAYLFFALSDSRDILYNAFSGLAFAGFALSLYYVFLFFLKKEAIGLDDIKLFFTIGLLVGFDNFIEFSFYSGFFGVIFGLFWTRIKKDDTFPFAPAILTSAFLCFILEGKFDLIDFMVDVIAKYIVL